MRGSIRQRGPDSWELRVFTGHEPLTGRKQYLTKTVRGGKRAAQRELAALVSGAEAASPTASMTVGEVLERWFEQAQPELSPSTQAVTRVILDSYLLPHVGSTPLRKLRSSDVDALYRLLRERGGRGGKALSPSTVQRVHNILRRALAQAVRWDWLPVNPAASATPPRRDHRPLQPPTSDEVIRLVDAATAHSPALGAYLFVAASTGARRGELVALRWSDVDLASAAVVIRRGIVRSAQGLVEKETKTKTSRRIALDAITVQVLRGHRARVDEVAEHCGIEVPSAAFVFSHEPDGSRSWDPGYVTLAFGRIARDLGIPVRLHDLRHFVATQLLANGVDVRTVAGRLGHKNPHVTLNVYAAFVPEADRQAADVLGNLLNRS